jgi:hypothetical protein
MKDTISAKRKDFELLDNDTKSKRLQLEQYLMIKNL